METDISVKTLTMTTEGNWSTSEIQKAQLEDPDISPILKKKLNSADRPSWLERVLQPQWQQLGGKDSSNGKKINFPLKKVEGQLPPTRRHCTTKRYWALRDFFHLKDGVLYSNWESDDGS
ncbi:hypothetical protein AVEN_266420-1 [Araneus ventricosus]|uniref:Uncharacterized protein n=1 Tax=Araneus ventricosus TaxID=182803 RepID=A0A4Y2JWL2_ARAVE|nr:hypothetical protein AVEN_266420-1 [Araneus ventricosus]